MDTGKDPAKSDTKQQQQQPSPATTDAEMAASIKEKLTPEQWKMLSGSLRSVADSKTAAEKQAHEVKKQLDEIMKENHGLKSRNSDLQSQMVASTQAFSSVVQEFLNRQGRLTTTHMAEIEKMNQTGQMHTNGPVAVDIMASLRGLGSAQQQQQPLQPDKKKSPDQEITDFAEMLMGTKYEAKTEVGQDVAASARAPGGFVDPNEQFAQFWKQQFSEVGPLKHPSAYVTNPLLKEMYQEQLQPAERQGQGKRQRTD